MTDDEPIADAYSVAVAAEHVLVLAEALSLQHGAEAARGALLVSFAVFAKRTIGRDGMLAELNHMIATLTENPTIEGAISQWLH